MTRRKAASAPSRPRLLPRLLLAVGAVVLGLAAGEGLARLRFRKNAAALAFTGSDLYYYVDPAGVRRHIPNKTGYERMWNGEGKAEFRINSLGFRGPETAVPKPAGVFRILALGDSITLGGRLLQQETFVDRLGGLLNAPRDAPRYEMVNAGVGDVGLAEERETLAGPGLGVEPDLVLLFWYLNDGRPPVGFPEETIYGHPLIRAFHASGLRRSYLAGMAYEALRSRLVQAKLGDLEGASRRFQWAASYNEGRWASDPAAFEALVRSARFDWGDAWEPGSVERMARSIRDLRDLAVSRRARFGVVMLPVHAQVYAPPGAAETAGRPQAAMGRLLESAGIPVLDLLAPLRAKAREPLFYDQCHYTPHGNGVVASLVADWLRSRGLAGSGARERR